MKAVARLLVTYFVGTRATKWLTVSGLVLMLASLYVVLYTPQTQRMTALAWPGLIVFFFGSSLMPLTFGRIAQSHGARILPGARLKLLSSAILTVLLVALPVGLMAPLAFVAGMSADARMLLEQPHLLSYTLGLALIAYTYACIAAFWLYVFIWFVSNERGMAGFAKAMIVLLVLLMLPARATQNDGEVVANNLWQLAVVLVVFSTGFLAWPRLKQWYAGMRNPRAKSASRSTREFAGQEIDLLLGNSRPWILIAVLLLPLAVIVRMDAGATEACLFFLTIASVVAGGNAERAPMRSRALWLRGAWTRPALFRAVERSTWHHNGLVLIALVLFLLGLGTYTNMQLAQMAAGIPLVILGTVTTTYLCLWLTRGVRLAEALLGVAVMAALMVISVMVANNRVNPWIVGASLAGLAAAAITLRWAARARWARIDWSQCRREAQPALRAG